MKFSVQSSPNLRLSGPIARAWVGSLLLLTMGIAPLPTLAGNSPSKSKPTTTAVSPSVFPSSVAQPNESDYLLGQAIGSVWMSIRWKNLVKVNIKF